MAARFFEQEDGSGNGTPPGKRVALVVGNGDYPHARLANAPNDARLIASALDAIGFSTEILLDRGRAELETAIVRLGERMERAGPGAFGFFYFAGHGVQHEGVNFVLPVDADLPDVRYLRSGAVPVDLVLDEIDRSGHAEATVVALDACRDNRLPDRSGGPLRGLASMRRVPAGTIVAFATAADQVADDGAGANSPFAVSLSKRLVEPGRRLDEVFFMVARDVAAATGGVQQPSLFVQGAVPPLVLHGGDATVAETRAVERLEKPPVPVRREPRTAVQSISPAVPQRFAALDITPNPVPKLAVGRLWVPIAAAAAALVLTAVIGLGYWLWPAAARATSVLVVNDGRTRIEALYVAPEGDGSWGDNRLGRGALPKGLGLRIQLKGATGCLFKMRAVYGDNNGDDPRSRVDLCSKSEVVFSSR